MPLISLYLVDIMILIPGKRLFGLLLKLVKAGEVVQLAVNPDTSKTVNINELKEAVDLILEGNTTTTTESGSSWLLWLVVIIGFILLAIAIFLVYRNGENDFETLGEVVAQHIEGKRTITTKETEAFFHLRNHVRDLMRSQAKDLADAEKSREIEE